MRRILLADPAISTFNLGDEIISQACRAELAAAFQDDFVVRVSTRLPLNFYMGRRFCDFDFKIVMGSNLLNPNPTYGYRKQWATSFVSRKRWGPAILMGVGWSHYSDKVALGQRFLWKQILHPELLHSVRDQYTLKMLNRLGYQNVLFTACPTTWALTPEHCSGIRRKKSDAVVFTLTDYRQDAERDRKLIALLQQSYSSLYFWPQGIRDLKYYQSLVSGSDKIQVLSPSLEAFTHLLQSPQAPDYVGNRLHGGIHALRQGARTLIIALDNRSLELCRDVNIPYLPTEKLEDLSDVVRGEIVTGIKLPYRNIVMWKKQFS
ncbi:MAG: polysaccharide pyruvyl transferase family protein [Bacillota bacterium]|nr:polysaccharide pyruvyl transferase family protein [Bacillota bacterium]